MEIELSALTRPQPQNEANTVIKGSLKEAYAGFPWRENRRDGMDQFSREWRRGMQRVPKAEGGIGFGEVSGVTCV